MDMMKKCKVGVFKNFTKKIFLQQTNTRDNFKNFVI